MSYLPSPKECINILNKTGCSEEVIDHCTAVRDLAVKIARITNADIKIVEIGALLHDIGRSRTHEIQHIIEGVKIAQDLNLSDRVIKIIERHVGAGITKDKARELGLPVKDYVPITLEEKIVCHADNLIYKNKKVNVEKRVEEALKNGFKDYAIHLVKLHKELSDICGIDLNKI